MSTSFADLIYFSSKPGARERNIQLWKSQYFCFFEIRHNNTKLISITYVKNRIPRIRILTPIVSCLAGDHFFFFGSYKKMCGSLLELRYIQRCESIRGYFTKRKLSLRAKRYSHLILMSQTSCILGARREGGRKKGSITIIRFVLVREKKHHSTFPISRKRKNKYHRRRPSWQEHKVEKKRRSVIAHQVEIWAATEADDVAVSFIIEIYF